MGSLEPTNGVLQGWVAPGWGNSSPFEEPAVVRSPELKPMVGGLLQVTSHCWMPRQDERSDASRSTTLPSKDFGVFTALYKLCELTIRP